MFKFAVIVNTYKRKHIDTKSILLKMFSMLGNQDFKDFKLFIGGDSYYDNNEFEEICKKYNGDIFYKNYDKHYRDGYFTIPRNKWANGGIVTNYELIKEAYKQNFDYYIHLDDDDIWESNHISSIVNCVNSFENVDFTISYSNFFDIKLPRSCENIKNIYKDNYIIKPFDSVHSSWCLNLKFTIDNLFPIYEERMNTIENMKNKIIKETHLAPMDGTQLTKLSELQKDNKLNFYFIPKITVSKNNDKNIPF